MTFSMFLFLVAEVFAETRFSHEREEEQRNEKAFLRPLFLRTARDAAEYFDPFVAVVIKRFSPARNSNCSLSRGRGSTQVENC